MAQLSAQERLAIDGGDENVAERDEQFSLGICLDERGRGIEPQRSGATIRVTRVTRHDA
jgi:hypothetical protein